MNYIIFKADGSINEKNLAYYIQQGNTGVDTIFVSKADIEDEGSYTCQAFFKLPNGTTNTLAGVWTASVEYKTGVFANGWLITLTTAQTTYNGLLQMSISLLLSSSNLLTYPVALVINETGYQPDEDSGVTVEEINSYLIQLQSYQLKYDLANVRGYNTLELATADLSNLADGQMVIIRDGGSSIYQVQSGALVDLIVNKATSDSLGNVIKDSYVSAVYPTYNTTTDKLFIETYSVEDGLLANNEVILPKATTTKNGLMAKEDKAKVDALATTYETQSHATATYQTKLTFDTTPTAGSTKPVTSGGIKTYVNTLIATANGITISDMINSATDLVLSKTYTIPVGPVEYSPIYMIKNAQPGYAIVISSAGIVVYNGTQGGTWTKVSTFATEKFVTDSYQPTSQKGQPNGYASLDSGGKVPTAQLPSYVDDVLEYANLASFPATGSASVIYVALDTNLTYRWSGSGYVEISPSLALGETAETAYRGDRGKIAYEHSQLVDGSNPHGTTFSSLASKPTTLSGYGITDAVNSIISITYADLKTLRDSSQLIKGQQYRITDFVTTTAQTDTQSAGHAFDLIVVADDVNKLNENARACLHSGDTYFANSKLEAWKIKYCLDNDTTRFAWADETNGKGVIYQMVDEFNNECPYDFKNIQFIRKITDGVLDLVDGVDTWVYTFTGFSYENNTLVDGTTLKASEYFSDEGSNLYKNNIIGIYEVRRLQEDGFDNILETLSDNVFIGRYYEIPYVEDGPAKIVLFSFNNNLGRDCYSNTFGNGCQSNIFGNDCNSNTFGNYCQSNIFWYGCQSNIFENYCYNNTFGNGCQSNTFGNYCQSNTFGDYCYYNTFGNYCQSNTFGDYCYYNTIVVSGSYPNNAQYIIFENGVAYIDLQASDATGILQNIHISMGVVGASTQNMKVITEPRGLTYDVIYRATGSEDKVA